jgi:hypothetical protein
MRFKFKYIAIMRNLVIYKDNQFPRYLQIIPSAAKEVLIPVLNMAGEVMRHEPGRQSSSGTIDIVTIPAEPIKAGDEFKTAISVIRIDSIAESRPARGGYLQQDVIWHRCEFTMIKSLLN